MIRNEVTIRLENGLEANPIALLVQIANRFSSTVYLEADSKRVNAKSIMGMMSMAMIAGEKVTVETDGEDEADANRAVSDFLMGKQEV